VDQSVFPIAAQVISQADREHPADDVLRDVLREIRRQRPQTARDVSRTVFTFYRWFGWLKNLRGMNVRIARALELNERYLKNPFTLPEADLRAKAVPDWATAEVTANVAWFRVLQREPLLWLRARKGQGRHLAKALHPARQTALPDAVRYDGAKDLFSTPEFDAGQFEVQDLSSQAVSLACRPEPGETWWDACAGEGGKTMHMSDLMENRGLIWATDRAEWRLDKLKRRAARAGVFNYRSAPWDGSQHLPTKTAFDGVLVDAPCSGVGTWQRNPHARWTTTIEDVRELAAVQQHLLANAAPAVKPGGKLIYAVCTLTKSETVDVVATFENQRLEFKPLALTNPLAPERPASPQLWFWPQEFGGNGMFVAAWERQR